jgi:NAD+ diphosphatase
LALLQDLLSPGEDFEHALVREFLEETGITAKNIRSFWSEPWPFPNSFMVVFTADIARGVLVFVTTEIESAFWFDREHFPRIL